MDSTVIFEALDSTGIPVAEDFFSEDAQGSDGSHAVLRYEGDKTVYADGSAYIQADRWSLSLYSPKRDEPAEAAIKDAMKSIGIPLGNASSGYDDEHRTHWCQWDFQTI